MAAFDRILSGISGLDEALDSIRLGDNVVWQVPNLESYRFFVVPYVEQAIRDGRNLIYVRFSADPPLLQPMEGLKIREFHPEEGFEPFTVAIHEMITEEGRDAFYVFDCLSDLQAAWWADLMMGNFFCVTCPYLFELDTVAYFPVIRGKHSFDTIARIRETTQLLLDIYEDETQGRYMYPLKVWNRYSTIMFLPKKYNEEKGCFQSLSDGVEISYFYEMLNRESMEHENQAQDSWDRWIEQVRSLYKAGIFTKETERDLCRSMITREKEMAGLVRQYFEPKDYFRIRGRMVGTGTIGGKACGMLLSRKLLEKDYPEMMEHMEPHDSFYIGSDVFYTYIVENKGWKLRLRQKTEEGWLAEADKLKELLLHGTFPANILEQIRRMLEYFGQSPIIVRSSSLLEDGFGNAFAGKYESVFCANQGTPEERLEEFLHAVRIVYASTMDPSALEYRTRQGLADKDEQMAILVQRVSGTRWGKYFLPTAAGVGYSCSMWRWNKELDPTAGMLRIVAGLGTRAVDRIAGDYPRLSNLDHPTVTTLGDVAEKSRYSQHYVDALDLEANKQVTVPLSRIQDCLPKWSQKLLLEHDTDAEYRLREMGRYTSVCFASCQGILEQQAFTEMMRRILATIQNAYHYPVDIEFTVNYGEKGDFLINLLQCRPLQIIRQQQDVSIPEIPKENILFEIQDSAMGSLTETNIDVVVLVETKGYYEYPYVKKAMAARAIGAINRYYKETNKHLMLLTPGRLGTSSPELGVPAVFADISGFTCLCEVEDNQVGYAPELSYGSHMFQDLVEAEIFYAAIHEDNRTRTYQPELLKNCPDRFLELCPEYDSLNGIIHVYDTENRNLILYADRMEGRTLCGEMKKTVPSNTKNTL